ncbi:MAG: hypothetical protein WAK16_07715, partial [Candidatus Cybelea sp.]
IKELHLAKVPIASEQGEIFKYVVPSAAPNYASRLHRAMTELVISVAGSLNQIVIHSAPGSAMMLASSVDEAGWPEVLGTVGGDDTILVIVRSAEEMPYVMQRFLDLQAQTAA